MKLITVSNEDYSTHFNPAHIVSFNVAAARVLDCNVFCLHIETVSGPHRFNYRTMQEAMNAQEDLLNALKLPGN